MSTPSINKIIVVGHLGADPEIRFLPFGDLVANLSVATNDRRSDGNGSYTDATEWHRVAVYGAQAQVAQTYLKKGAQVYVEGKLRSSKWTDRNGVERKSWSIISDRMVMLGKPNGHRPGAERPADDGMAWMDGAVPDPLAGNGPARNRSADFDDDIPF